MTRYSSLYGTVDSISPMPVSNQDDNCVVLISIISDDSGPYNFVVFPATYVLNHQTFAPGDSIIAFYETMAPVPLIYPPQLKAILLTGNANNNFGVFDYFDEHLINSDNTLQLNLNNNEISTVVLSNGQIYSGNPGNHYLLVLYKTSTRSIPAITTPEKVVVFCMPNES